MNEERRSEPLKLYATGIRRITLGLPPVVWCLGLALSLFNGNDLPQSLPRATAFALSWFAGWLVYLRVRKSSDPPYGAYIVMGNISILQSTRAPFPFPRMLAVGLMVSIPLGLIAGLIGRLVRREKLAASDMSHPLADAEIDRPSPDH